MVAASKHSRLKEIMPKFSCKEIYHPWNPSCLASVWDVYQNGVKGSAQILVSLYTLQLILSRHTISRQYLKHQAKNYIRSLVFGSLLCPLALAGCCTSTRLTGKCYYHTFVYLPTMLSGFAILVEQRSKQELYICTFFSMALEYVVRLLVRADKLQLTTLKMCASFMLLNAAVMYLMRRNKTQKSSSELIFWFFTPPRAEQSDSLKEEGNDQNARQISVCYHSGSCWSHALKAATSYLVFGVVGQTVRILLPQLRKLFQCPAEVTKNLFLRKNFSFGMFLGAYVGIYHAVSCLLSRFCGRDSEGHAVLAGFLAGAAFLFNPKLGNLITVFTATLHQLAKSIVTVSAVPCPNLLASALCSVLCGVIFHGRIVDEELCHPVAVSWIRLISGGRCDEMRAAYLKYRGSS